MSEPHVASINIPFKYSFVFEPRVSMYDGFLLRLRKALLGKKLPCHQEIFRILIPLRIPTEPQIQTRQNHHARAEMCTLLRACQCQRVPENHRDRPVAVILSKAPNLAQSCLVLLGVLRRSRCCSTAVLPHLSNAYS
jgi:hypothetical protein